MAERTRQLVARPSADIAPDCRHYRGDRPCVHNRLCSGCDHYAPYRSRVCIIKLGALGDVIRTLCILPEVHRRYPDAQVTWVTQANGARLLAGHSLIQRVITFDAMAALTLSAERFDLVISLDKEVPPCALATTLNAWERLGVGLSEQGTPVPLNPAAAHYLKLGLSDELKFTENRKSYPQLVYEALGWPYNGQRYELPLDDGLRASVRERLAERGWDAEQATVGVNVGSGRAFANKMWPAAKIANLVASLRVEMPKAQVMLLGGPAERAAMDQISALLAACGVSEGVIDSGTDHGEKEFVAVVDACDVLFGGDTMAMHVAIARRRGVVAFFGPTCEQEIDLFGAGEKLVAQVACGPCYKRVCDQADACVSAVSVQEAEKAITRVLARMRGTERVPALRVLRQAG